jgi:hypothetical protein
MTGNDWTNAARIGLAGIGVVTFGSFAQVHVLLALVVIGLWAYYAATYPPPRVALFYVIGTTAGLVLKEAL